MVRDSKEISGIVGAVSRQAGTVAGTSVILSKKIAGCGVRTVTAAKDWLKQPLKIVTPARDKKSRATSEASALESRDEQETGRKKAAKALIAALESDLAVAQRELKKAQSNTEKTQSQLASQLDKLQAEKESLISELNHARSKADKAIGQQDQAKTRLTVAESDLVAAQHRLEVEPAMEPTVAQSVEELNLKMEEQPSQGVLEAEVPSPVAVTDKEVQAAVFPNATDKIIFTKALSYIASQDVAARADAAKAMAGIRHELSVRALVAQMAHEPSAQVRQECVKALTTLEMKQGLHTVKHALTDQAALVRSAAVRGLYRLAGAESAPALIHMFSDESEAVRRRAAACVGWLGQEELAVELLPLLADSSASVRRAAAEAMGSLRSRRVVSALIERLKDPDEAIRKTVLGAIEKITAKKMGGPFPRNERDLQRLIAQWRKWWKKELLG